MTTPDIIIALHPVVAAFERLNIPYFIGGSAASSIHGVARTTLDADLVADIKEYHVAGLQQMLVDKYYIDEEMIIGAIKAASSFNLIHFETAFKIDIFIHKDEPHQRSALARKIKDRFDDEQNFEYYFAAPEDLVIAKLQWFEQGNRVSQRQWHDIVGVIQVQGEKLDIRYLKSWSKRLGLDELLQKAFLEGGIP